MRPIVCASVFAWKNNKLPTECSIPGDVFVWLAVYNEVADMN